jgi:hypothetical protein
MLFTWKVPLLLPGEKGNTPIITPNVLVMPVTFSVPLQG